MVVVLGWSWVAAFAQPASGSLAGKIIDTGGAPLPGAVVTLKGIAEHLSRSGTLAGEATLAVAMALNTAMPPMRTAE